MLRGVADDVTSGVAVDYMDIRAKFYDSASALNRGRIIQLVAGWCRFTHLHAVFNFDKREQFCDPSLYRSQEIRPKAVGGGIFGCFSEHR